MDPNVLVVLKITGIIISIFSIMFTAEAIKNRKEQSKEDVADSVGFIQGEGTNSPAAYEFLSIDSDFSKARKHELHELIDLLEGQLSILDVLDSGGAKDRLNDIVQEQLAIAKNARSFSWVHGLPVKTAVNQFKLLQDEKVQTAQALLNAVNPESESA
jgi:hypothetical protein